VEHARGRRDGERRVGAKTLGATRGLSRVRRPLTSSRCILRVADDPPSGRVNAAAFCAA
jgi:hypothetical protein